MKYFIETYGCQMNVHDSERMAGLLEASGYEAASGDADADVVVINTCSVREKAEEKLHDRLGVLKGMRRATGHAPLIAVAGCVAQQEGSRLLQRSTLIDVVVGTQQLKMLPTLVAQARGRTVSNANTLAAIVNVDTPYDEPSFPLGLARYADPVKAYVTIIEGCNDFCSFCVVPYTRGHERMRTKREILDEVRAAVASGRSEIQLLGQIVNHYQAPDEANCDFAELLAAVNQIPGVRRIRFASPHPRHASERLIAAIRDLPAVCKHIHLPVQSGSTTVLQRMRRRHTREQYLDLIAQLRRAIPNLQLSTDIIVGFPGETAEEWADTMSLVEAVRFHCIFSFKYSIRPNTLASKKLIDDVSEATKTRRIRDLQMLQRQIQLELHDAAIGARVEVLVDARSRRRDWELSGRSSGNTVVNFPGPAEWVGKYIEVEIKRAGPYSVWGEAV